MLTRFTPVDCCRCPQFLLLPRYQPGPGTKTPRSWPCMSLPELRGGLCDGPLSPRTLGCDAVNGASAINVQGTLDGSGVLGNYVYLVVVDYELGPGLEEVTCSLVYSQPESDPFSFVLTSTCTPADSPSQAPCALVAGSREQQYLLLEREL